MEAFIHPRQNICQEKTVPGEEHMSIPPETSINVSKTGKDIETCFNLKNHISWEDIIGTSHAFPVSAWHHNTDLLYASSNFFEQGFLKAGHWKVSDEYVKLLASSQTREKMYTLDWSTSGKAGMFYVGDKSYIWGADMSYGHSMPLCSNRYLAIKVDSRTRKTAVLKPEWKQDALKSMEERGQTNTPMEVPKLPEDLPAPAYSFSMTIKQEHTDLYKHTNFKIYVFGGIICIQNAVSGGCLTYFTGVPASGVLIRDMFVVYEKECIIGDIIRFCIYETDRNEWYDIVCYKGDVRLTYGRYQVVAIPKLAHL